jgi:electron transport complex protein RnfG
VGGLAGGCHVRHTAYEFGNSPYQSLCKNQNLRTQEVNTEAQHINLVPEPAPSSFRLIFSLGAAGFFSGLLLVSVYIYTLPLIEANKTEALQKAIFKVLPGCQSYATLELIDAQLQEVGPSDSQQNKGTQRTDSPKIFAGFDGSGHLIGFAIPSSEPGFQDVIGAIYGYDATEELIIGFEVLESKETPGLGDKIFKDKDFQTNFTSLSIEPEILAVKKGAKTNPYEVETITGATISSKAIIRMLNNSMNEWKPAISNYMKQNELKMVGQK